MKLIALIRKELLLLTRDRHALAVLFVMPAALMVLMAFAMAGINRGDAPTVTVALEVAEASDEADFFGAALGAILGSESLLPVAAGEALSALQQAAPSAPRSELERPSRSAPQEEPRTDAPKIRLASDFAARLLDTDGASDSLTLILPALTDTAARQRLRSAVDMALAQTRLMAFLSDTGALPSEASLAERLALVQARTASRVAVLEQRADGALQPPINASQHNVPAWLIFGMFFITVPMAHAFQSEQQSGTLMRLRALDLSPTTLALGKWLPYFAVNLVQFALLLTIGAVGLPLLGQPGLELGGGLAPWLLLAVTLAAATSGLGLAVAGAVRSTEQALLIGGGLNLLLAAAGGVMAPKSVMPAAMLRVAELSPMSWALDGFLALLVERGGVAELLLPCGRLLLFALAAFALGLFLFRLRLRDIQWTTQN